MNKNRLRNSMLMGASGLVLMTSAHAGTPVWTFAPVAGYPPSVTVSSTGNATIQYMVTNQSIKSHILQMKPIQGITPSGCTSPLGYQQSCLLILSITGSALQGDVSGGPVLCDHGNPNECYQPSQANSLAIRFLQQPPATATLTPSALSLALSVQDTGANAALTGNPRQITIQNTGTASATNVLVSSSGLPSGTSISGNTCIGTLNAGSSCTITLTPSTIVSSDSLNNPCTSGTQAVAGTVTIKADGGLSSQVNAYVLSYGCIYQGGFIYSVDDSYTDYPESGSIGGKIAATKDTHMAQTIPAIGTPNWGGYATDIGTSLYETSGQGVNDGQTNSHDIVYAITNNYSAPPYSGTSPVPLDSYAAGLCSELSVDASGTSACTTPNTCYTGWYLPAMCELAPFTQGASCTTSTNIQQQLFENTLIPSATLGLTNTGYYWSSTEYSLEPLYFAWFQNFVSGGGSFQFRNSKEYGFGVRCSRALTP